MEKVFSISRHFGMSSEFMDFFFGLFAFIALFEFHLEHYEIICSGKIDFVTFERGKKFFVCHQPIECLQMGFV
jgi:hypothetical protein